MKVKILAWKFKDQTPHLAAELINVLRFEVHILHGEADLAKYLFANKDNPELLRGYEMYSLANEINMYQRFFNTPAPAPEPTPDG